MVERTVDLWEHLPSFLKQFKELDKLLEAERPEFQLLVRNEIDLLNNLFILTATNEGLKRFEKILNIYPSPDDSIETRRNNVMVKWYSKDIYTMKTLKNRLDMLQGNDNVQLEWDETDNFLLHVVTRLDFKGQVDTLASILESMLPANVAYQSVNYIEFNETFNLFYGVGMTGTGTLFLTDDFNETVTDDLTLYYASGIVGTGYLFLTDNFNENVNGVLSLKIASGVSVSGNTGGFTEEP